MKKKEPRFNFSSSQPGIMKFGNAPKVLHDLEIPIYTNYSIVNYPFGLRHFEDEEYKIKYKDSPSFSYEGWSYDLNIKYSYWLLPGKYITHSEDIKDKINPLKDDPSIFLKFVTLGSTERPNEIKIINFVRKYGLLKTTERLSNYKDVSFDVFPLEAYYLYAREAYIIWRIYLALERSNVDGLRQGLIQLHTHIPIFHCYLDQILDKWKYIDKYLYELIKVIKPTVIEKETIAPDVSDPGEELLNDYDNTYGIDKAFIFWEEHADFLNKTSFEKIIKLGPKEMIYEMACDTISSVINIRLSTSSNFKLNYKLEKDNKCSFQGSWNADNLLSAIWLLFYLKISKQVGDTYRLCPVCEEPIINPDKAKLRMNQEYHPTCRQVLFNRIKRGILRLWEEGKNVEDIAEIVSENNKCEVTVGRVKKLLGLPE